MADEVMTQTDAIVRLKELVEEIDFTMMTTTDDAGNLVSRPMSTRQMDENGDIWFFTADDTKKVDEVEADHDLGLSYLDSKGMRFVSVAGRASIVHDRAKMKPKHGKIVMAAGMLKALVTKDTPDDTMRHEKISC